MGVGFFETENLCPDLKIENGQIQFDNGLETAVLITLFSDRYTSDESQIASGVIGPRGWWGDDFSEVTEDRIGSKLWVYDRGKLNTETSNAIRDALIEAFAWMIEDGLAQSVNISTRVVVGERVHVNIDIEKPDGENIVFQYVWDAQELKRV